MVCLNHKLINFDSESEGNKLRLHHGPVSLGSKEPGCRGAGKAVSPRFPQPRAKRCLQFSGCFWKILLEFLGKISGLSLQTEKENNQKKKGRAQKEDYLEVRHSLISQIFTRQVHSFSWFQQNSRLRLTLLHNHQKKKSHLASELRRLSEAWMRTDTQTYTYTFYYLLLTNCCRCLTISTHRRIWIYRIPKRFMLAFI